MTPHGKAPKMVRCAIYTRKSTSEGLDSDFNTLDDGSWAYGDQLEQYDFPLQFRATVERCPEGKVREVLAALRAWAVADEGLADGDVWIDVMGDPGLPTIHTTRVIAKEGRWAAPAELCLRARVTSAGGDGVRLLPTFLRPS